MGLRLVETPKPEDLEEVIFWVRQNGRPWPVDANNIPLQADKTPFSIGQDGLIEPSDQLPAIDPQETEDDQQATIMMAVEPNDADQPMRLVFRLKMLLGRDLNQISQAITKTTTKAIGGKRNRAPRVEVESDVDLNLAVNLKLMKAIIEWENILDENGNKAPINEEYIGRLPGWLQNAVVDKVEDMSSLDEDTLGE